MLAMPGLARAADSDIYVVRDGDTLSGIAVRVGARLSDLLRDNGLAVTSLIVPGQRLVVPGATAESSAAAVGSSYTVSAGDTLSGIAARHGVSLSSLLQINGLTVTSLIVPGMAVTLPAGASATTAANAAGAASTNNRAIDVVLAYALAQLGRPYQFFSAGPSAFDCSGLTLAAYARIGVTLIHHSASQAEQGTAVSFMSEPIRPGDLVFMATRGAGSINHVGIAVSSNSWIQSRRPGDVVRIGPLPPTSMIIAVRRFVPA